MRAQVGYLLFFICLLVPHSQAAKSKIRVGIVGAGLGGTSAAYWLNQYLPDSVDVTIFDSGEVGGRLKTVHIGDHGYESGGLAIIDSNLYMARFTEKLGLKQINERIRFFTFLLTTNGSETLVGAKSPYSPMALKSIWRYGLDAFRSYFSLNTISSKFGLIHGLQDAGNTYSSVKELLDSLHEDFYPATRVSLRQFLTDKGFSKRYIDELAQLSVLGNYEQSVDDMNGLPGLFALGALNEPSWHVEGGNRLVPVKLLEYVTKNYGVRFIPGHVKSVKEGSHGDDNDKHEKIRVTYQVKDKEAKHEDFDYVIISAPVHRDMKDFVLKSDTKFNPQDYLMHEVHTNFVKSTLNGPKYNITQEEADDLDGLLYCDTSIPYRAVLQPRNVYRDKKKDPTHHEITSVTKLHAADYKEIFGNDKTEFVTRSEWYAYPKYEYPQPIPPMKLGKNIYYPSAIEWIGSFMEVIVVSARNTAMLIAKERGANIKKSFQHTEF